MHGPIMLLLTDKRIDLSSVAVATFNLAFPTPAEQLFLMVTMVTCGSAEIHVCLAHRSQPSHDLS